MGVVWFLAGVVVVAGGVRVARHRAQAAADLSALAAARHALADPEAACRVAHDLARANGAALRNCVVHDGIVDVTVALQLTIPWPGPHTLTATARAGPV
ncbi:secretion/DNA translocation related TadE-like protein [Sphaerisporangium krabiense]|uniref:Secretion/DNA translocation related TadE-like protein n=2 Tax=Sphaerisporangium krabiense TaxID=763782 RepID=A0A7W8Z179_9ACTN|nr:secretion/DNA translocation related TadE-like protein [Sphaerisporangium krabiense]